MPKILFIFSTIVFIFAYGVGVGKYEIFPHKWIDAAVDSVKAVIVDIRMVTGTKPTQHIKKLPSPPAKADPVTGSTTGYTAVSGFFDDGMEIRLLDGSGNMAHRWPVSFKKIWPDPGHIPSKDVPQSDWNTYFNGIIVHPDGSVVFPFRGLIKLDSCGEVIWKSTKRAHHSVERSPRGTYWSPGSNFVENGTDYLPFRGTYYDHTVVEFSADGEVLREISVVGALKKNKMFALLNANNRHFELFNEIDIIHLNDAEEIPTEYLPQFPQFSAGDILLSLREPNLVMVMDPETQEIKWHMIGPWNQQHDTDWQPDGTITLFNNNYDRTRLGTELGGSSILSVDPKTNEVKILYGEKEGQRFYSAVQGDHQVLENGNIVIVESTFGRVFEVTSDGTPVWEYVNYYSEDEVLLVSDVARYPEEGMDVASWQCSPD